MTIEVEKVRCPKCETAQRHVRIYGGAFDLPLASIRCFCVECKNELKGEGVDWQDGIIEKNWRDCDGVQGWDGIP